MSSHDEGLRPDMLLANELKRKSGRPAKIRKIIDLEEKADEITLKNEENTHILCNYFLLVTKPKYLDVIPLKSIINILL